MFKVTFIVSIAILGTLISAKYHNVHCDSCGEECKPACGTRQFKNCCYNYLRKKRAPEVVMVLSPMASLRRANLPSFADNIAQDVEAFDQHRDYPSEDFFDTRPNNNF